MSVLLSISSLLAPAGLVALMVCAHIAARRIGGAERRLVETNTAITYQTELCAALLPVLVAARATLLACPSCELGVDEPCVCSMRRRSLAAALEAVDEFNAKHPSLARGGEP